MHETHWEREKKKTSIHPTYMFLIVSLQSLRFCSKLWDSGWAPISGVQTKPLVRNCEPLSDLWGRLCVGKKKSDLPGWEQGWERTKNLTLVQGSGTAPSPRSPLYDSCEGVCTCTEEAFQLQLCNPVPGWPSDLCISKFSMTELLSMEKQASLLGKVLRNHLVYLAAELASLPQRSDTLEGCATTRVAPVASMPPPAQSLEVDEEILEGALVLTSRKVPCCSLVSNENQLLLDLLHRAIPPPHIQAQGNPDLKKKKLYIFLWKYL